jgi:hypothetical protein
MSWFLPVIQEMMAESFRDESIREKLYSLFNNEGIYFLSLLLTKRTDKEQSKSKNMATALLAMGYGLTAFII